MKKSEMKKRLRNSIHYIDPKTGVTISFPSAELLMEAGRHPFDAVLDEEEECKKAESMGYVPKPKKAKQ